MLILAAGMYVIFFAGLSWKLILPVLAMAAAAVLALVLSEATICADGVSWPLLHDYQQHRIAYEATGQRAYGGTARTIAVASGHQ